MKWRQAYADLRNLVTGDNEILLTPRVTLIPEQIRPRFYQLFDLTRTAFLREHLPDCSEETKRLRDLSASVEENIKRTFHLEEIVIPTDLRRFLNDGEGRLSEPLFDPLFELLRGERDVESFEKEASIVLEGLYAGLYQRAYRHWVILSLIELSRGSRAFSVKVPLIEMTARGPQIVIDPHPIPKPHGTSQLSFLSEAIPAFIVPDVIVDSTGIGRFVAFKTEMGDVYHQAQVMWKAADASPEREWFSHEELEPLWKRYHALDLKRDVLIYVCGQLSDLGLVADSERFARPDGVMIWVSRSDAMEKLHEKGRLYRDHLKPRSGVFMILLDSKKEIHVSPCEGIHWLPVALDQSKLLPILYSMNRGKSS
jgi:hypothetical protein